MSKYARNSFKKQDKKENKYALIHLSSFSSPRWYVPNGTYGGTKRFDSVFGTLVHKLNPFIDTAILYPGPVTTAMTGYEPANYRTCTTY